MERVKNTYTHILLYVNLMVTTSQKYIIDTHRHTRERNSNITLKIGTKSQGKRKKEERNKEELQNQTENSLQNGNKYIPINNYIKCKWTKCSNQKTQNG